MYINQKQAKQEQAYYTELIELIRTNAKDTKTLKALLEDLLTPAERLHIAKRWQVVKQLHQGVSHREVSANLGVGISTVTRGTRELADATGSFHKLLNN